MSKTKGIRLVLSDLRGWIAAWRRVRIFIGKTHFSKKDPHVGLSLLSKPPQG